MATYVRLKHKETGIIKAGYYGFSWTTLFFGPFPALIRGDYLTFLGYAAIMIALYFLLGVFAVFVYLIVDLVWPFIYNKYYTSRLLERGYRFADDHVDLADAQRSVGIETRQARSRASARIEPHF